MNLFKTIRYVICLTLLLTISIGIASQPIALAATKNIPNATMLPPNDDKNDEERIELNSKYPVLSSIAGVSYTYDVDCLYEGGEEPLLFNLQVNVPEGFNYSISRSAGGGSDIAAIQLDPNRSYPETIKVTVRPYIWLVPEPGEYDITVEAISGDIKDSITLKAIITASYKLNLETPEGLLNTKVTAGKDNYFSIIVRNTGTANLENIAFNSKVRGKPSGWSTTFTPEKIDSLPVGSEREVEVNIKPPEKTISGDYEITVECEPESKYAFDSLGVRVTVLTKTIWGWVGVGIVIVVIIGLIFMFMRLGRR